MDWSRIKTIFIVAFLVLDVFLMTQLSKKYETNKLEELKDVSFEEKLKVDGIEYSQLPKEPAKDQYMSANTKNFKKEELALLKNQDVKVLEGKRLESTLKEPYSIGSKFEESDFANFVKSHVLFGDQYGFWEYDKDAGTITYFQKYKDKLFFNNVTGRIIFHLNENHKVVSYEQTMLEKIEPISEKEEILSAMRTIEALHRKGNLKPDSKIKKAEPGYYTLVNMPESQVLTPTWHFIVERDKVKEHLLVNAIDGQVFQASSGDKNQSDSMILE